MEKDQIAKIICFVVGCVIACYVILWLLPYIEMFLALCGAYYLLQEYTRNNRRNRY